MPTYDVRVNESAPPPRRAVARRGGRLGLALLVLLAADAAIVAGLSRGLSVVGLGGVPGSSPSQPQATITAPARPGAAPTSAAARPTPVQTTGKVPVTADHKRGVVLIAGETADLTVAGTGMVLTSDGQVVTNYHVVRSTTKLTVTLASNGKKYPAKLVGRDATLDVALLQLTGATGLDVVTLDEDDVAVGDVVIAAGNANGQGFVTANRGNVQGLDRRIMVRGPSADDPDEPLDGLIETNAPGWPGDSGGPMFDAELQVLGMTTAGTDGQMTERKVYAVPVADVLGVVEKVRAGDESGTIVIGPKAFLGVVVRASTGLKLSSTEARSPAAKAGLKAGDTLTSIDGKPVNSRAELVRLLDEYEPGGQAEITWQTSAGATKRATVTFAAHRAN